MRIGMILDKSFPPDPRVENEARVLMDAGFELFLFCLDFNGLSSSETHDGIEVRRYGSSSFEYRMSALAYTVPVYSFLLKGRIRRFLVENQIDVIHVHDMVVADAVQKAKPSGAKGTFVKRVSVASTQGPGVKIDPSTLAAG